MASRKPDVGHSAFVANHEGWVHSCVVLAISTHGSKNYYRLRDINTRLIVRMNDSDWVPEEDVFPTKSELKLSLYGFDDF